MRRISKWWDILKQAVGEGDYERYSAHLRRKHPGRSVPGPAEFYMNRLKEKYSRPTRCC